MTTGTDAGSPEATPHEILLAGASVSAPGREPIVRRSTAARFAVALRDMSGAGWVVTGAIVLYIWYTAALTIRNHQGWGTFGFDYGIYDQALWLMSRFKAPFVTIMGRNLFGDHTSFILLPFVPLYWIWPDGRLLLFAQSVALGSTALPLYRIARRVLGEPWQAATLAVAFLVHPAIAWTNTEQFHPDVFALPLLAFAFLAMLDGRWRTFVVCCTGVTMVKEDMLFVIVPLGLYCAWRHDRRRGFLVAAWSFLWSLFCVYVVLRLLNGKGSLNWWRIPYGSPGAFVRHTIRDPGSVANYLRTEGRPWYLWQIMFPVLGISVVAPAVAALALLPLLSNVVSTFWFQHQIQYHYTAILIPPLYIAAMYGLLRLRGRRLRWVGVVAVGLSSLWSGYLWGPMPVSRHPTIFAQSSAPYVADNRAIAKLIPPNAVVSAYYGYVPHIEHRTEIYQFPVPFRALYWGVRDEEGKPLTKLIPKVDYVMVPTELGDEQATMDAIKGDYVLAARSGDTLLYRRRT